MRSSHNNQSVAEVIFEAIQNKQLDPQIIEEMIVETLAREWDLLNAISFTLTDQQICKRKTMLYEIKIFLTFIRACKRACS